MDMTGLNTIKAVDLKPGNIVCFDDWNNDFKVVEIEHVNKKVNVIASNLLGTVTKNIEYDYYDDVVILKV